MHLVEQFKLWNSEETNIFNGSVDAFFGFIVMIVIPSISLIIGFFSNQSYSGCLFNIITICFAAAYDTYGRYKKRRKFKLQIRLLLLTMSLVTSIVFWLLKSRIILFLPQIILVISGLLLSYEMFIRFKYSIDLGGVKACCCALRKIFRLNK